MADPTEAHDLVGQLEAELDRLEEAVEQCRKSALLARALVAAGTGLLAFAVLRPDGTALVLGVAGTLGGLVLAGSTRTTRAQLLSRRAGVEAARAELIDRLLSADDARPHARAAP